LPSCAPRFCCRSRHERARRKEVQKGGKKRQKKWPVCRDSRAGNSLLIGAMMQVVENTGVSAIVCRQVVQRNSTRGFSAKHEFPANSLQTGNIASTSRSDAPGDEQRIRPGRTWGRRRGTKGLPTAFVDHDPQITAKIRARCRSNSRPIPNPTCVRRSLRSRPRRTWSTRRRLRRRRRRTSRSGCRTRFKTRHRRRRRKRFRAGSRRRSRRRHESDGTERFGGETLYPWSSRRSRI
jgi:hypothetical protein